MVGVWCCFIVRLTLFFAVLCLPQNLLASGVQMESDVEELDDEVMACVCLNLPSAKINKLCISRKNGAHLNLTGGGDGPGRFRVRG